MRMAVKRVLDKVTILGVSERGKSAKAQGRRASRREWGNTFLPERFRGLVYGYGISIQTSSTGVAILDVRKDVEVNLHRVVVVLALDQRQYSLVLEAL